jgi:hypothetical protein
MDRRQQLDNIGYQVVTDVLEDQTLELIKHNYDIKFRVDQEYESKAGNLEPEPDGVQPFSIMHYADRITESLCMMLHPFMLQITGVKNLMPSYSFVRYYQKGNWLESHQDRESCQYSVSLPLVKGCNTPWPIFLSRDRETDIPTPINLNIGDMLIFKGYDLHHWREPYTGDFQIQAHFHYVDADDPKYSPFVFDKRPGMGFTRERLEKLKIKKL